MTFRSITDVAAEIVNELLTANAEADLISCPTVRISCWKVGSSPRSAASWATGT
jgi:hypothetical protein